MKIRNSVLLFSAFLCLAAIGLNQSQKTAAELRRKQNAEVLAELTTKADAYRELRRERNQVEPIKQGIRAGLNEVSKGK